MSKKIFSGLSATRKKELCDTLESHPNITEVHFAQDGHHYFNVYEHSKRKFGHIAVQKIRDQKKNVVTEVKTPMMSTLIVETSDRDELIGGEQDNSKQIKALNIEIAKTEKAIEKEKDEETKNELVAKLENLKSQVAELE